MDDLKYSLNARQVQELITTIRVAKGPGNTDRMRILDKVQAAAKIAPKDAKLIELTLSRSDLRAVKVGVLSAWDDLTTDGGMIVRSACRLLKIWNKGVEPSLPKGEEPKADEIEDLLDDDGTVELDDEG